MNEEEIRAAAVGEPRVHDGTIDLADYDPAWPDLFTRESDRIRSTLGNVARALEHVGSTSVPGLAAKPIIDIVLAVSDPANEAAYVPALEAIGYVLRIREPDWYEHRMLARNEPGVQIHVFSEGCPEIERMVVFRNRLRGNTADRDLYERTKRHLARRTWRYVQNYADAKTAVVNDIIARARERGSDSGKASL
jgi:GrpB-like predicted nucleotidyltransferase (UPF0157 family)